MKKQATTVRPRRRPAWKVVRVDTTPGLYRLIAPLKCQKGRQKTLCVAIGSKRLKDIVDILNEMEIEV